MEVLTKSAQETQKLGEKIATDLIGEGRGNQAKVLSLRGELGSGKTTFVQGLARGLGLPHRILSPTFILSREYPLSALPFTKLVHIDLYKIEKPEGLASLGLDEILADPANIVVIEWAERLNKELKSALKIEFIQKAENERVISVT